MTIYVYSSLRTSNVESCQDYKKLQRALKLCVGGLKGNDMAEVYLASGLDI